MDQNQPGHDPYAFIMNDAPKAKPKILPQPNSRKQRLLLAGGGFVVLFFVLVFGLMLLSSLRGNATKQLLEVARTQNEIIRVSGLGIKNARSGPTQAFAQSTSLSVTSSQKEIVDYLAKQGVKTKSKDLATAQNSKTDATLEAAQQAGKYDEVFVATLKKELAGYQVELKTAFEKTDNPTQKKMLQDSFKQVTILLENVTE